MRTVIFPTVVSADTEDDIDYPVSMTFGEDSGEATVCIHLSIDALEQIQRALIEVHGKLLARSIMGRNISSRQVKKS